MLLRDEIAALARDARRARHVGQAVNLIPEVRAVAGNGLEGDRYFDAEGTDHDLTQEVTLIEIEGIEAAARESRLELTVQGHAPNIVTRDSARRATRRGVHIGDVGLEGLTPNPPCRHLQELAGNALLKPMIKRGGIRARIVVGGTIRVGDAMGYSMGLGLMM